VHVAVVGVHTAVAVEIFPESVKVHFEADGVFTQAYSGEKCNGPVVLGAAENGNFQGVVVDPCGKVFLEETGVVE